MILAVETATDVCSVAFKNSDGTSFEKRSEIKGTHSENLFLFVNQMVQEHSFEITDLDAVVISEGPGSYTGLRIAASAVKGLLFNKPVPLYGINTLASFAVAAVSRYPETSTIHGVIDAKRKHLYHQKFSFKNGRLSDLNTVKTRPIEKIEQVIQPRDVLIGTGIDRLAADALTDCRTLGMDFISAKSLLDLYCSEFGNFTHEVDIQAFEPKYYTSNQAS